MGELEALSRQIQIMSLKIDKLEHAIREQAKSAGPPEAMKLSELVERGYSKEWLMKIYRLRNQKIAWKIGNAPNSAIYFDLSELEKYRRAHCVGGRGT